MSKAKELGAIMLFGEKYDKNVRMIQFGTSKELCGGTHVSYSGQIGVFKIISEVSISSGIRRIEALTGNKALEHLNETNSLVSDLVGLVKDKDVLRGVENLISHSKYLEKQLKSYKTNNLNTIKNDLLFSAKNINGFRYIAKRVDLGADELKSLSFSLRKEKNLFLVLGSVLNSKPILSIMLSDDLVKKGLNASNIIREISKEIDGGGGGQPFFATAGGSNPSGLEKALELSKIYIK